MNSDEKESIEVSPIYCKCPKCLKPNKSFSFTESKKITSTGNLRDCYAFCKDCLIGYTTRCDVPGTNVSSWNSIFIIGDLEDNLIVCENFDYSNSIRHFN